MHRKMKKSSNFAEFIPNTSFYIRTSFYLIVPTFDFSEVSGKKHILYYYKPLALKITAMKTWKKITLLAGAMGQ